MEQFTIGGLTAKRGEKVNGFISVEGTRIQLPVTLICGTQDGETYRRNAPITVKISPEKI